MEPRQRVLDERGPFGVDGLDSGPGVFLVVLVVVVGLFLNVHELGVQDVEAIPQAVGEIFEQGVRPLPGRLVLLLLGIGPQPEAVQVFEPFDADPFQLQQAPGRVRDPPFREVPQDFYPRLVCRIAFLFDGDEVQQLLPQRLDLPEGDPVGRAIVDVGRKRLRLGPLRAAGEDDPRPLGAEVALQARELEPGRRGGALRAVVPFRALVHELRLRGRPVPAEVPVRALVHRHGRPRVAHVPLRAQGRLPQGLQLGRVARRVGRDGLARLDVRVRDQGDVVPVGLVVRHALDTAHDPGVARSAQGLVRQAGVGAPGPHRALPACHGIPQGPEGPGLADLGFERSVPRGLVPRRAVEAGLEAFVVRVRARQAQRRLGVAFPASEGPPGGGDGDVGPLRAVVARRARVHCVRHVRDIQAVLLRGLVRCGPLAEGALLAGLRLREVALHRHVGDRAFHAERRRQARLRAEREGVKLNRRRA